MKIQAVLIDGFKNLSNVKISFDNITALVALNNFGKSNVLSGIDFGLAFIKATIEDKKEMMANSNLIPINCNMIGQIRQVMPHIKDSDMEELGEQVLGKLQSITDEEFAEISLEAAE